MSITLDGYEGHLVKRDTGYIYAVFDTDKGLKRVLVGVENPVNKLQLDGNKLILDVNGDLVLNPHRSSGWQNFSEDLDFRDLPAGMTAQSGYGVFDFDFPGGGIAAAWVAPRLRMPIDTTKRGLSISVTATPNTATGYNDCFCELYFSNHADSYTSYNSPTWVNLNTVRVNLNQTVVIPFPDYRCRVMMYVYFGRGVTHLTVSMATTTTP